jgi:hypothetical protein
MGDDPDVVALDDEAVTPCGEIERVTVPGVSDHPGEWRRRSRGDCERASERRLEHEEPLVTPGRRMASGVAETHRPRRGGLTSASSTALPFPRPVRTRARASHGSTTSRRARVTAQERPRFAVGVSATTRANTPPV